MSASNWNSVFKAFHDIVAIEKKPKVVIVAVMHKMPQRHGLRRFGSGRPPRRPAGVSTAR
jgi:hypothetical protein